MAGGTGLHRCLNASTDGAGKRISASIVDAELQCLARRVQLAFFREID